MINENYLSDLKKERDELLLRLKVLNSNIDVLVDEKRRLCNHENKYRASDYKDYYTYCPDCGKEW